MIVHDYRKKIFWHLEVSVNFTGLVVERLSVLNDVMDNVPTDLGPATLRTTSVVWSPGKDTPDDSKNPFDVETLVDILHTLANMYPNDIKSIEFYGWKMTYFVDEQIKPLKESETSVGNNE